MFCRDKNSLKSIDDIGDSVRLRGQQVPVGQVTVSGAKNSATRLLCASLLTDKQLELNNFPTGLVDFSAKAAFIRQMGVLCDVDSERKTVKVCASGAELSRVPRASLPVRTTYLLAAGQLMRWGQAYVPYPGGCRIGNRGYDFHIAIWRALGIHVEESCDGLVLTGWLRGGEIEFPLRTVGGTENALLSASVACGETKIRNAYITPEVRDLLVCLQKMGAQIQVHGNSRIRIQGNPAGLGGAIHTVVGDRIEALTWLIYGAVSGGRVHIRNAPLETMASPFLYLREAGIDPFFNGDSCLISPDCVDPDGIQPFEVACATDPGVISDMQPFFGVLALFANGRSRIYDVRYPLRNKYAQQMARFTAGGVYPQRGCVQVDGPCPLWGAEVTATDLRGSMALLIAALCAGGESRLNRFDLALRGYDNLLGKLEALGVAVEPQFKNK